MRGKPGTILGQAGLSNRHVVIGAGRSLGGGLGLSLGLSGRSGLSGLSLNLRHHHGKGCRNRGFAPGRALPLLSAGARRRSSS